MSSNPLRWLPFGILPSECEIGRTEPEIVEMALPAGIDDWAIALATERVDTVQSWPISPVMHNFALQAVQWFHRTKRMKGVARTGELRHWMNLTKSIARNLPFTGPAPDLMAQAVAEVERQLDWPCRFFEYWPTLGTYADAQKRVSLNIWAMDTIIREVKDSERAYAAARGVDGPVKYLDVNFGDFWSAMFDGAEVPFVDYKDAKMRASGLDVLADRADALMVLCLRDVMHRGYYGPDDLPRPAGYQPTTPK